jgi:predicted site-specific integrase-resolvase
MDTCLTITQAATYVGRSVKTLQRWDRQGILQAGRTPTGRRVYTKAQLTAFVGHPKHPTVPRRIVAYCRVSSAAQKPDLKNQRAVLEEYCAAKGLAVDFVEEIGGGLNFSRKRFLALMDAVARDEVSGILIAHKDRLVRFGYVWFDRFCQQHGCTITVLNQERLSPEQEMVQDLMTIVHCFSSRLYGLRRYKEQLKQVLAVSEDKS